MEIQEFGEHAEAVKVLLNKFNVELYDNSNSILYDHISSMNYVTGLCDYLLKKAPFILFDKDKYGNLGCELEHEFGKVKISMDKDYITYNSNIVIAVLDKNDEEIFTFKRYSEKNETYPHNIDMYMGSNFVPAHPARLLMASLPTKDMFESLYQAIGIKAQKRVDDYNEKIQSSFKNIQESLNESNSNQSYDGERNKESLIQLLDYVKKMSYKINNIYDSTSPDNNWTKEINLGGYIVEVDTSKENKVNPKIIFKNKEGEILFYAVSKSEIHPEMSQAMANIIGYKETSVGDFSLHFKDGILKHDEKTKLLQSIPLSEVCQKIHAEISPELMAKKEYIDNMKEEISQYINENDSNKPLSNYEVYKILQKNKEKIS